MQNEMVGKKIASLRKQRGLSQKQLAREMNVSSQLVSKWENSLSTPGLDYLTNLCEIFEVNLNYFRDDYVEEPEENASLSVNIFNKTFWASLAGIIGALLVLSLSLLTIFCFVPASKKQTYLNEVDNYLDKNMSQDYFNISFTSYTDNQTNDKITLQCLKNGDEIRYQILDKEGTLKEGYQNGQKFYLTKNYNSLVKEFYQLESTNLQDICEGLLKTAMQDYGDVSQSLDDVDMKYIRKTNYGYFYETTWNTLDLDLTDSQLKVFLPLGTPNGNIIIKDGKVQQINLNANFKIKGEKHSVKVVQEFSLIVPEIEIDESNYTFTFESKDSISKESLESMIGEKVENQLDYFLFDKLATNNYQTIGDRIVVTNRHTTDALRIYSKTDFSLLKQYTVSYFPQGELYHLYGGYALIWDPTNYAIKRINLETFEEDTIYSGLRVHTNISFNEKYVYACSYETSGQLLKIDIESGQIVTRLSVSNDYPSNAKVKFVLNDGTIYYEYNNGEIKIKNGTKLIKNADYYYEEDGKLVAVKKDDDIQHCYVYEGETLVSTFDKAIESVNQRNMPYTDKNSNAFTFNSQAYTDSKGITKTIDNFYLKDDSSTVGNLQSPYFLFAIKGKLFFRSPGAIVIYDEDNLKIPLYFTNRVPSYLSSFVSMNIIKIENLLIIESGIVSAEYAVYKIQ